ncbi:MAG: hypothetical protein FJZ75_02030 [Bacteroidetes bacterium]|nr:hypothetical protein [Bacteroidota bacterium]
MKKRGSQSLSAARFLATNARMGVALALATNSGIYGATLFASRFLATNARMVVAVWVASKTPHSCIRGYPNYAFLITTNYEYHANLRPENIPFVHSWLP